MLKNLLQLVYPSLCCGCNLVLLKSEEILCTKCNHNLPKTFHEDNPKNETFNKFYGLIPIEMAMSLVYFRDEGLVQEIIHKLKYKKRQEVGIFLANRFSAEITKILEKNDITEIIPVPLHKKRFKQRGYNQLTTFCQEISKNEKIPLNEKLLIRTVYTETQTHKNKEERQKIENPFEVLFSEADYGKHFLLVDDVITTGSTLEKCCKTLLKIPNAKVSILTMAYTQS